MTEVVLCVDHDHGRTSQVTAIRLSDIMLSEIPHVSLYTPNTYDFARTNFLGLVPLASPNIPLTVYPISTLAADARLSKSLTGERTI